MSMLKTMLMKKKGGETKTLNLESVGGATYDDDYIFESNGNQNIYFITKESIPIHTNPINNDKVEIILKCTFEAVQNSPISLNSDHNDFSIYMYSTWELSLILRYSDYIGSPSVIYDPDIYPRPYIYLKMTKDNTLYSMAYSNDGITYTNYYTDINKQNVESGIDGKIIFGKGNSSSRKYGFKGRIDFKGCSIKVNDQEVLWI